MNPSSHLAHKYDPDLMEIHLDELSILVVSSPEAAKLVLKTHDLTFCSRPSDLFIVKILYNGCKNILFAPYDEYEADEEDGHTRAPQLEKSHLVPRNQGRRGQGFR
ncbi:Cytochrome P450 71A24 [Linum perenne]